MHEVTDFVRCHFFHRYIKKIACTGGGAFKVRFVGTEIFDIVSSWYKVEYASIVSCLAYLVVVNIIANVVVFSAVRVALGY